MGVKIHAMGKNSKKKNYLKEKMGGKTEKKYRAYIVKSHKI